MYKLYLTPPEDRGEINEPATQLHDRLPRMPRERQVWWQTIPSSLRLSLQDQYFKDYMLKDSITYYRYNQEKCNVQLPFNVSYISRPGNFALSYRRKMP